MRQAKQKPAQENASRKTGVATRQEAWEFLQISESTLNKMIREEAIVPVRFGRSVRIPWSILDDLAKAN